jgi:hypothetical protein
MYQKDQYASLHYNPTRDRLQRPQTPGAASNQPIQSQFNQSYTKNPITYSPHKYANPNVNPNFNNYPRNPNISKSRISVSSSASQLSFLNADQG